ncbi:LemA family protein [candidate division KSB1 bacterium]|nr:MAG: LemA family protein [candidate division KSB1 bacterium]
MSKGAKTGLIVTGIILAIILIIAVSIKNIYNNFVSLDESVSQSWSQVQNVYQRRADLIPNLVETVKGYAKHEKQTLQAVTEARAKLGGVTNINANDLTPEKLAQFQQAQAGLSSALQRLMVVVEKYPDLKANQNFIRLQDELAGTENRIAVERKRFTEAVQAYNRYVRRFPQILFAGMFGFEKKAYFEADKSAQQAPKVKF